MKRSAVLSLVLASFIAACGSSPSGATSGPITTVEATSSSTTTNVAQKASEPRTGDPTAARTVTTTEIRPPASPFANMGMTGASTPGAQAANTPPKKISARHVLVQWMGAEHAPSSVVRSREQALAVATDVLHRAQAKEDFARLAVEYSDEPNAGARGGSLGRFGHGQMVPEFEAAAFKLQVGEISGIVESPFGFHVIQRTE